MRSIIPLSLIIALAHTSSGVAADPLKVLFLGDRGHHAPAQRFAQLEPVFKSRGITLTYTDSVNDLNLAKLNEFDGLMIFANHTEWKPEHEKALLNYVAGGKGFIPVHCASFCFNKSPAYIDLVGAQFRSHTTGVFRTTTVAAHPIMTGCDSFASWDETYVHHKHNEKNRVVLEVRTDGDVKEPWTWVRTHDKGRVFYTAWGHDHRTWSHPGFQTLLERGTRWACGQNLDGVTTYHDRPKLAPAEKDLKPFEYVPAKLPHYVGSHKLGGDITTMQKPLSAAESVKHYRLPEGFTMKAFVTEEQFGGGKPIAMTWDERGRLYVALTLDYPNELKPEGEGRDRIVMCEDTDGDGVCDKVSTFAEKLSIPTSMLASHGGLIVHMAPNTIFLKDTDGDGKADLKRILFTGWGTRDTHAGPSNLRYGPDGWVTSMVGYSGFDGTVAGEKHKFGQGLFRFKLTNKDGVPEVAKLEFLRSTTNNSWGVGFTSDGELFGSTANGCPLVHMNLPNRYFEKIKGLNPGALQNIAYDWHVEPIVKDYRQVDWHGGFTAAAGCTPYTASVYPPEYRERVVFICEPTAHLVAAMVLQPVGTSYVARYGWNLCASDDDWAAPIDAQVGPDGQVWMIDWYNIIVQHNPTPHGYTNGKGNAYEIDLRDKKYGRIYRIVYDGKKANEQFNLKDADETKLNAAMQNDNLFWRTHAQRLMAERGLEVSKLYEAARVGKALNAPVNSPESLRLYLRGLMACADAPPSTMNASYVVNLLNNNAVLSDATVSQILAIAASVNDAEVLVSAAKLESLQPAGAAIVERVAKQLAAKAGFTMPAGLLESIATAPIEVSLPILDGIANGLKPATTITKFNAQQSETMTKLIANMPGVTRGKLIKIARAGGVTGLDAALVLMIQEQITLLADDKKADAVRLDAARQILEFQPNNADTANALIAAAVKTPKLAPGLFDIFSTTNSKVLTMAAIAKLNELPATARPQALRLVLARPDATIAFLDAVEKGTLRFDMLALDQKTALAMSPDKGIAERAKKLHALGGGLPDADRQKVIEQLMPLCKKTGDAGAGKKIYAQHCAKCHKHGNEGQVIGPDLTGFAVHPKEELLIHILDPSRSVEGNFKQYIARVADGRVLMGLLASETKTSVELLDAENKRHTIEREDLESFKESPKSLMPEGFEKQMTADELSNLLEFLTQKGKYVPIPLDKAATIVSTKGMFHNEDALGERMVFADWKPKAVKGVPFVLVDPQGDKVKNVILLNGPDGELPPRMPKTVTLPCNTAAKAIHLLSGVSGWGAQGPNARGGTSLIVRLHYADGKDEDHALKNGQHFADYIRRFDVPGSEFAFELQGKQQVRYLAIQPKTGNVIKTIELVKGDDKTAPVVMAVTVETP